MSLKNCLFAWLRCSPTSVFEQITLQSCVPNKPHHQHKSILRDVLWVGVFVYVIKEYSAYKRSKVGRIYSVFQHINWLVKKRYYLLIRLSVASACLPYSKVISLCFRATAITYTRILLESFLGLPQQRLSFIINHSFTEIFRQFTKG